VLFTLSRGIQGASASSLCDPCFRLTAPLVMAHFVAVQLSRVYKCPQGGLVIVAAAYGRPAAVEALLTAVCRGESPPSYNPAGPGEATPSAADESTPGNGAGDADASAADGRCYTTRAASSSRDPSPFTAQKLLRTTQKRAELRQPPRV